MQEIDLYLETSLDHSCHRALQVPKVLAVEDLPFTTVLALPGASKNRLDVCFEIYIALTTTRSRE